ncbi:MAG TPA: GNAT family N-acetyltransferase [Flavisolibacter sp.]|nr:GNAT family N-acetyltransferase [Flavisolibacter sp.]
MQIFVETPRLILRELLASDAEGMFELDSDPLVHKYLGNKPIQHIDESRKIIDFIREQYISNGIGRWAVIEKSTNTFLGWSGLKLVTDTINGHNNYYDLGYRIIPRYWGKGYASESAIASVQYGFDTMGLKEIFGIAEEGNIASQNVLQKAGLKFVEDFMYEETQMKWYLSNKH